MAYHVISRADAKAQGLMRYFTGRPCKWGHVAERYAKSTHCIECLDEARRQYSSLNSKLTVEDGSARSATRKEAILLGLKRYYTGKPCPFGHVAERRTVDAKCVVCYSLKAVVRAREWAKKNPERRRQSVQKWRDANPEKFKESTTQSKTRNKDKYIPRQKEYYQENKEALKERYARYYQEKKDYHLERAKVGGHKRRAQKTRAGGTHTAADVAAILKAQGHRCVYCQADLRKVKRHIDHVMPLALGGSNDKTNIQILCEPCNRSKGAKDPIAFARERGRLL